MASRAEGYAKCIITTAEPEELSRANSSAWDTMRQEAVTEEHDGIFALGDSMLCKEAYTQLIALDQNNLATVGQ